MRGRLSHKDATGFWSVHDGVLHGNGGLSHLFSPRNDYRDFRVRAEVKINDGGNSGIFLRVAPGSGYVKGYEAQINSTHTDPRKTGSLYRVPQAPIQVSPSPVPPNTWFVLEAEVAGYSYPGLGEWQANRSLGRPQQHLHARSYRDSNTPSRQSRPDSQTRSDGTRSRGKRPRRRARNEMIRPQGQIGDRADRPLTNQATFLVLMRRANSVRNHDFPGQPVASRVAPNRDADAID